MEKEVEIVSLAYVKQRAGRSKQFGVRLLVGSVDACPTLRPVLL